MKRIRKAVLPVAGLGTRFLPATKAVPKEMMCVVDRPVVQHVVDEARAAGIEQFIFVTGRNKAVIEDHFDIAYELNRTLAERGKTKELEALARDQPKAGETSFTRQQEPLGLGHAVWCARELVGDEPFAVILPDMLSRGSMEQMIAAYDKHGGNIIAVEEVPADQTHQYGIVSVGQEFGQTFEITGMVEKPPQGHRAVELHHLGPLHPAAAGLRPPVEPGARRRQRDPAHRFDDPAHEGPAVLRHEIRGPDLRYRAPRSAS